MKFSTKLLLCTMMLMAAVLGFSGFYFVNYVFESSLEREIQQALDESSILRFAFETAAQAFELDLFSSLYSHFS